MPYPYYNGYNAYQSPYQNIYQQGYNPQPMNIQPQQMQQNVQTPTTPPTPPTSIMWVNNEREAAMYPILPNTAVALWDESSPVVYLKQADASGKPTMKTFDLVERTERVADNVLTQGEKLPDYATKDDVRALAAAMDGMNGTFDAIRSEIDTMKGDLYGIAGKKKPAKKPEVEDE